MFRNQTDSKFNKVSKFNDELEASGEFESDNKTVLSQRECTHLKVRHGVCKDCNFKLPQYGIVLDTGTVSTFIKVLFIDESKP